MKKLLFIGMVFHEKTRSVAFLKTLLEKIYSVAYCFVDPVSDPSFTAFDEVDVTDIDVLVCLQVMPPRNLLSQHFRFKHAVFFPMFDSCPRVSKLEKWLPYREFQIVCFCQKLAKKLCRAGFSAHSIQFFPKPPEILEWGDPKSIFFWNRRENINISTVERLFAKTEVEHLHVHKALDPGCRFVPSSSDFVPAVSYSEWHADRHAMTRDMLRSAYYVAPRKKEGIGMSFLEAMAMGRCVVAPDNPTMNEYIVHGYTGFLYNEKRPRPISVEQVREIQSNAHAYMVEGFKRWEQTSPHMMEWFVAPVNKSLPKMFLGLALRFIQSPVKVIRVLKEEFGSSH
jgi:hypothetical protein